MAELVPAPFRDLVMRLFREPAAQGTLFDLPKRAWYAPQPSAPDMTVRFHGKPAGNPLGPASGPHTQMAQNLLLAYIAGARIMELKTVQVNDRLTIPRPCIDMTNVGYNVEWSQELRVEESLREYVAGMMLVEMFRHCHPDAPAGISGPTGDVIYDISLGYDLKGIKSDAVQAYLDGIRHTRKMVEMLRSEIPSSLARARDLHFPNRMADTLTLSTFHGCPTDEIEAICEFLMRERELDVIVKMNPPTIGRERMEHLLHDVMGYREITVRPEAYSASQTFDEAVQMTQRLRAFAQQHGRKLGCKFSNTLEVLNHRTFFTPDNQVMYLSGAPLHVITMALTAQFREAVGPDVPITFSAGIDAQNVAAAVACGFASVTICSDLLKPGGYGRFGDYLRALEKAMQDAGAISIDDFLLKAFGKQTEATERAGSAADHDAVVRMAGVLNTAEAARRAEENPRYRAEQNRREPKRIDSRLHLFDCITCDKCVPVCPNDANFTFPAPATDIEIADIIVTRQGWTAGKPRRFTIAKKHQIANYAEFCNECGNCDTFCPEYGGPYIEKPSFYLTESAYLDAKPRDGFLVDTSVSPASIRGRVKGVEYTLNVDDAGTNYLFGNDQVEAIIRASDFHVLSARLLDGDTGQAVLDAGIFHSLRILRNGVLDPSQVNQINAACLV